MSIPSFESIPTPSVLLTRTLFSKSVRLEYGLIFWNYTCPLGKQFSTRVFECIGSETRLSKIDYKCYHLLWCPQTNCLTFLCLSFLICKLGTHTHTEVAQSCPTLCDPMDCSPPGSSVHGIFQAWILEWVDISFSRGSSWARDQTQVSRIVGRRFTVWATREDQTRDNNSNYLRSWHDN